MAEIRQGRIIKLLCVLFISCSTVDGSDDNTTVKPGNENCNCDLITIIIYGTAFASVLTLLAVLILGLIYCIRNPCCKRCQQRELIDSTRTYTFIGPTKEHLTKGPTPSHTLNRPAEDCLTKGRISNLELWELVQYSARNNENDKLSDAILHLTRGEHDESTPKTDFQSLCSWRDSCAPTEQMDKLCEACLQAEMGKTVEKLKDFRYDVSKEVSECDLDYVLWQIGKKSSENITTLLNNLMETRFSQESSVPKNVHRALPELQKWTKGKLAVNPAVMLSMQSDEWCDEDKYFFTVSEEDKSPLEGIGIKLHVRNVSKAHCRKIMSIISMKGNSKRNTEEKGVNKILDENETVLFNTSQMTQEWLDEQECSHYEKRIRLRNAVEDAKKASKSSEIRLGEIEQLASKKGDAEAAYELLMKDIKPFAAILGLDESKLSKYKQESSSSQSPRGTVELVADVTAKRGRKIF